MAVYKAPLRDMRFVLNEVFEAGKLWAGMEATREVTPDLADAILEEAARMSETLLFPLNRGGDEEGCTFDNGVVKTPAGFREAFRTFAENGWTAFAGNPAYGGQGMPKMLSVLFEEMICAANSSFALYALLTNGACLALDAHANESLKALYLPKLYSGEWTGTMCLTEPHAGSDLGIIRTKAEPDADGTYKITGTKIFITGGEHDLTDNIIHLVLAKLPGAPEGSRGISLFLVPRNSVSDDGSVGENNGVSCGSIEHKMGIQGSATCVINFDGARGWLIGEANQGLAYMFTMMNYERLSIGLQGLALGEASYQSAVDYARERLQGRSPEGAKAPEKNADPIIVHADVRRMLLNMRAYNEAGRALASYLGMQLDLAKHGESEDVRKTAADRVALLTPVAKAFFSDRGFDNCVTGQQVFGGHGYVREWGMEQHVRDARIAQIYEGTNGIQAIDLAGRKVVRNKGQYVRDFVGEIRDWMKEYPADDSIAGVYDKQEEALKLLERVTEQVIAQAQDDPDAVSALAVEYLDLFALVTYGWLWLRMINVAAAHAGDSFYDAKLVTGRYFFSRLLPRAWSLAENIGAGSALVMALDAGQF